MDIFLVTFEAVATLFVIGLVGFAIISRKLVAGAVISAISPLLLEVALPSLTFIKIVKQFTIDDIAKLLFFPLAWCLFTVCSFALSHLFKFVSKESTRGEFGMTLFFQNAMFIPIILLTKIYGDDSRHLINLFLFTVFYAPFFFNFYHIFFKSERGSIKWSKVFHPTVLSTIIAVSIVLFGIKDEVPNFVLNAFTMIGAMTLPLLMIIVGGNIYVDFSDSRKIDYKEVFKFVVIKNFIYPLIAILTLAVVKPGNDISIIIFLQAASPPLMALPLFASRCNRNRNIVNQFIVGSFAVSIVSIPLMFLLYSSLVGFLG